MKKFLLLSILVFTQSLYSQKKPSYPEPKEGFKRVDLLLPKIDNPENYRVEIKFGMKFNVSVCAEADFTFLPTNLVTKYAIPNSQRFEYYWIEKDEVEVTEGFQGNCESTTKVERKILSSPSVTVRYQSYNPIPFYIPKDWTLEYRIWKTDNTYITVGSN